MKKSPPPAAPGKEPPLPGNADGSATSLDAIVKLAYRRHARGRIARAAMRSCLGN